MQWRGRRSSSNVEDRRGGSGKLVGGGIGGIIIIIIVTLLGGNPGDLLNNITSTGTGPNAPYTETAQEKELSEFVSVVLADTEDVWTELFQEQNKVYEEPTLVLFTDSVQSACGVAGSSTGPFYCPGDHKLYIDLSFYDELQREFQAPGDFAMAYVIAHEVGHHVQNLLGTNMSQRSQLSQEEANEYSVRLELQADYYAGVWASHAQGMNLLEAGDLEEALTAASAVGDDTIQKKSRGYAVPESFTHGTSEQRKRWFNKGFQSGTISGGDTFNSPQL
ncbi:neutral zinc metallopeptidase [Paenibacillus sp. sgz500958]|uniref:KPN_02809 family neutral zinc metallopeptidase n=1 Tax=Paenibacillus sp. sgz500958 TaxID=3242475 RepID=UPI0036D2BC05